MPFSTELCAVAPGEVKDAPHFHSSYTPHFRRRRNQGLQEAGTLIFGPGTQTGHFNVLEGRWPDDGAGGRKERVECRCATVTCEFVKATRVHMRVAVKGEKVKMGVQELISNR